MSFFCFFFSQNSSFTTQNSILKTPPTVWGTLLLKLFKLFELIKDVKMKKNCGCGSVRGRGCVFVGVGVACGRMGAWVHKCVGVCVFFVVNFFCTFLFLVLSFFVKNKKMKTKN